ncbi:MAG: dihydrolipoyl dehydrogenase [Candidatus Eremiobacteraeota bacterium]|nr:dihydrolipoyl dehydrogenase [Candidatus Eremiobacteraeota bacterium]
MNRYKYDLVVVGGGSAGYAAARTARDLGATVALADRGPLGGLCILRGCMPSKTLIASSDRAQDVREGGELGIRAGEPTIDMRAIAARKRAIIRGFADYRIEGLQSFPLYEGEARFESPRELRVGDDVLLTAKSFIIATGSSIAPAAVAGLAETGYIDSDALLDAEQLPKSVIVFGGGYVGSELGQFLSRMGVQTTVLIRAKHLLSGEDDDVGDALTFYFRDEGIDVRSGAVLSHVERDGNLKRVHFLQDGNRQSVAAEDIFHALGRVPNFAGLDLEKAGVECHAITGISAGPDLRTCVPHIFAVGDVTGHFALVHVAIYQGEIAARNAVTGGHDVADYSLQKTHTIFTDPQVAIAGRTEKELKTAGTPYLSSSYLFSDHGKAIAIGKTKGFVKMMASPQGGRILGAAIVGPEASDLIHEVIVALHYGATAAEFARIPHLHPTLAEILTYPAEDIVAQMEEQISTRAVAAAV